MINLPNKLKDKLDCKQGAVRAVVFNGDGNYCVTCGSDKTIKLWNPHKKLLLKSYCGHGYDVLSADCSCDNSQICSGGIDKAVVLWEVSSGKILRKYRAHAGQVNCVTFNEDSSVILSGSLDGTVKVWDTQSRNFEPIQVLDEAKDSVTCIHVSDHEILTGSADGHIRRYDLRAGKLLIDYVGKMVSSVKFTKDGQCTLVGTVDGNIRLLDKDSGELLNTYIGHKNCAYKLDSCLSGDDSHVISGSEDGFVYIWDLINANIVKKLDHQTRSTVHSVSHHPNEPALLTASGDHIYLWTSVPEVIA